MLLEQQVGLPAAVFSPAGAKLRTQSHIIQCNFQLGYEVMSQCSRHFPVSVLILAPSTFLLPWCEETSRGLEPRSGSLPSVSGPMTIRSGTVFQKRSQPVMLAQLLLQAGNSLNPKCTENATRVKQQQIKFASKGICLFYSANHNVIYHYFKM